MPAQKIKTKKSYSKRFLWLWEFFGIYIVIALFVAGFWLLCFGQFQIVWWALASLVIARLIFSSLMYLLYKKARPYQTHRFTPPHSWLFSPLTDKHNAFPSDHAASFASVTSVLLLYVPVLGVALFICMILNGFARVRLGYHDWWDILAGWIVGFAAGSLVYLLIANNLVKF